MCSNDDLIGGPVADDLRTVSLSGWGGGSGGLHGSPSGGTELAGEIL